MHKKLAEYLDQQGIKDLQSLSPEEKATYDQYQAILSDGEVTVEKVLEFCKRQMAIIEMRWRDFEVDEGKKAQLIPYRVVYSCIAEAITAPRAERALLERKLDSLIKRST